MLLRIGWLFPSLMSTYGDRGNIICLRKRAHSRSIQTQIVEIEVNTPSEEIVNLDLLVGGGSQDKEQEIVIHLLKERKGDILREKMEQGMPALLVCGAMQIMGQSYQTASGEMREGVGFLDCITLQPEVMTSRFTGDFAFKITPGKLLLDLNSSSEEVPLILGFENHRGCTYLGKMEPLGEVIRGYGNNGKDHSEGVFSHHVIATYAHGPLLPKNPFLADWLIRTALKVKYNQTFEFKELQEDQLVRNSRALLLKRLGLPIRSIEKG